MQTYSEKQVQEMITEVDAAIETLLKSEKDALVALQKGAGAGLAQVMGDAARAAKSEVPTTTDAANGGMKKGEAPSELDRTARDQLNKGAAPEGVDRTATDQLKKAGPDASAAPVAEDSSPADASPSASPPASDSAPAADPSASASADPAAAGGAQAAPTEQELAEAYGQLSQPELELHAKALAQVMAAKAGAANPMAPQSAAPPASPSAAPASAPAPGASPLPGDQSPGVDPNAMSAMKSENKLLRSQVEDLQKGLSAFTEGFKDLMAPKQKAVTGMDIVPADQKPSVLQLTKSEINEKLRTVVRKPELTKTERKLITRWYSGDASDQDLAQILSK